MKLLIGGSPCTHWSIAQTKNRETEASGIGWELFLNYRIARDKFHPDYFLYENNKSMSAAIREQITRELGVEPILINSALVSAQSRQRLYWTNIPGVQQPEDRGILLRDILESGVCWKEKAYTLRASHGAHGGPSSVLRDIRTPGKFSFNGVTEPVRIGTVDNAAKNASFDSQQYRVYSPDGKSVALCGNGGGVGTKTGLYAIPAGMAWRGRGDSSSYEMMDDQKANAVMADGHQSRLVIEDAAIFQYPHGFNKGGVKYDKTPTLTANGDWPHNNYVIEAANGKTYPVYEVRDGKITIKGMQYPIKLADGFYIIRKLTVTECKRLQTVPEEYIFPVSDTQAYKMLGNGWTVDVIAHILSYAPGITSELLDVFSMYDGMSCGHIALDKLGADISAYYATEIDKYAIQTTQHNFPETVQLGDAFQVRNEDWGLPGQIVLEEFAEQIEMANWPEAAVRDIVTMAELERRVAV